MHPSVLQLLKAHSKPTMPTLDEYLSTYRNQSFSLPSSIIYYIAKNPSAAKMYQKMVQCCKYFFIKNPIIIIEKLCVYPIGLPRICYLNTPTKLWILHQFFIPSTKESLQSLFKMVIPKIYKLDVWNFSISNVSLSFEEFLFLSSPAKIVDLDNVSIKYSNNGKEVDFEKLVEVCPDAQYFEYAFPLVPSNFSTNTIAHLIKIPHFSNLKRFRLQRIPDTVNVRPLIEFLKKTDLYVTFEFSPFLSEDYCNQLKNIIIEIFRTNAFIYGPPPIIIPTLDPRIQYALKCLARKMKK